MENHVPYRLYRDFHSRDFPASPVTMLVWSRLVNNESHFYWKTVRSVEEEHRAEEEITAETAATQTAQMWVAAQRFLPAAVSWSTKVLYHNYNDERRKRCLPCEIRTGNCSERVRISTKTVGSMDRSFQRPPTTTKALLLMVVPAISIHVPLNQTHLDAKVRSSFCRSKQAGSRRTLHKLPARTPSRLNPVPHAYLPYRTSLR